MSHSPNGWGSAAPTRRLAIVGSHPDTRLNAPYDDPAYEIWLFNESAQKPEIYRRWDALLQIHRPEVYTSLTNWVNKDHWEWLQQDHGERRIFMIEADPRVPNSVRYPLEGVLSLAPYRYLRSSPAMSLALAIYLGYQDISLYGSELSSSTEYGYQAPNYAFWIGFAHGRGIDLHLECWQSEFNRPIYGFEGEAQIDKEHFAEREEFHQQEFRTRQNGLKKLISALEQAMQAAKFQEVADLLIAAETAALEAGIAAGALAEAGRYAGREDMISRQEFERVSAQAMIDGEKAQQNMYHAGGKAEYVWNVWKGTGRLEALQQLRVFIDEKLALALESGKQLGIYRENIHYLSRYDELVTAMGGVRALHQMEKAYARQPA